MIFRSASPAPASVDTDALETFLERGVSALYPGKEEVRSMLLSGKRLKMYLGIDPTAPTLHVGHVIALRKMREFQRLGHEAILLIGGFTGLIGDPTDKLAVRRRQTPREVAQNARLYKEQASRFLSFSGRNAAKVLNNASWLSKLTFADIIDLSSHLTVGSLLKRDMFEDRMKEEKPIYLHEFLYPLMQGYDSVAMDVDGEIGGNDQIFNMLVGRDLLRDIRGKEKFVMAVKLLADPSGRKMGKSEGNMIAFTDSPQDMFGKVMSWNDGMIAPGFELLTDMPKQELSALGERMKAENPRDLKLQLAREIVSALAGEKEAAAAHETFLKTFSRREAPGATEEGEYEHASGPTLRDALRPLMPSMSELTRLAQQGGVEEVGVGKIHDLSQPLVRPMTLRLGKKRFVKVTPK